MVMIPIIGTSIPKNQNHPTKKGLPKTGRRCRKTATTTTTRAVTAISANADNTAAETLVASPGCGYTSARLTGQNAFPRYLTYPIAAVARRTQSGNLRSCVRQLYIAERQPPGPHSNERAHRPTAQTTELSPQSNSTKRSRELERLRMEFRLRRFRAGSKLCPKRFSGQ